VRGGVIAAVVPAAQDGAASTTMRNGDSDSRADLPEVDLDGGQGLTLVHYSAQLEDLRNTSLTVELNLRTPWTHPRVKLDDMGDKVSFS